MTPVISAAEKQLVQSAPATQPTSSRGKLSSRIFGLIAAAIAASALFWFAAQRHSHEYNDAAKMEKHDQLAIMNFSRRVYNSLHTPGARFYTGTRNKMPLYPFIQALAMTPNESNDVLFSKGKTLNILMTMAGLAATALIFFRAFPIHLAANLSLISAFSVFVYKAAYFQPDALSYFLSFGVFLLIWHLFVRGGYIAAIACGVMLALSHYCKGTAPPMLLLFAVFYGGAHAILLWQERRQAKTPDQSAPRRSSWHGLAETALVIFVSLALLSPYLRESKQRFGSYFYNVNSTFYMWLDSWEDAKTFSAMYDDRHQAPNIPPDQLPSPRKYLRDHTIGQVLTRLRKGISAQFSISLHSYGYMVYLLGFAAVILFIARREKPPILPVLKQQPYLAAFLVAYFGGYYLLYSWYEYVGRGQRFILGLFLPAIFTLGYCYLKFVVPSKITVPFGRTRMPLAEAFNWLTTFYCTADIVYTVSYEIVARNGGS